MLREIVFDTETTGFHPEEGDKLVEIGAVELVNHVPTGVQYHQYINPEREVPEDAFKVHGLNLDFLKDFPTFREVAQEWLDFVGDAKLVAHNASFDMKFVNFELKNLGYEELPWERVIDTLEIARKLFPGSRVNLDALCKRYGVDNTSRTLHGALLDAQLLAEVYLEMLGGQEPSMLVDEKKSLHHDTDALKVQVKKTFRPSRNFPLSDEDLKNHEEFLQAKISSALWLS